MSEQKRQLLNANAMRTRAIFERKVGLAPKDLNKISKLVSVDDILIEKIRDDLEGKCSQHGWVIPGTVRILSRSMCQNEAGRFTGSMVSWVQVEADVYYPTDYMLVSGEVLKKNKMGMFVIYENAVQIIVPRDLHLGRDDYDTVEIGQYVEVELKKSRFQVTDPYISSVGVFKRVVEKPESAAAAVTAPTVVAPAPVVFPAAVAAAEAAAASAAEAEAEADAEAKESEGINTPPPEEEGAGAGAGAAAPAAPAAAIAVKGPAAAAAAEPISELGDALTDFF